MRLMSFCCVAISAAMTAVMVPIHAMTVERLRRGLNEKADAHQHVNACGHHGRGVDQAPRSASGPSIASGNQT